MRTLLLTLALAAVPFTPEERLALEMLADVSFRSDTVGLQMARKRFEEAAESSISPARRYYFIALTDWLDAMSYPDPRHSVPAAKRGLAAVEKAIALDPTLVHAYIVQGRLAYVLLSQGEMDQKDGFALMTTGFRAAKKLAPEDPLVRWTEALFRYYTPGADKNSAREMVRAAIDVLATRSKEDPHAALWLPILWNFHGYMYLGEGELEKARSSFDEALKARPDYKFVRMSLIRMTEPVDPGAPPRSEGTWRPLLTDAKGDQRFPGMPDLQSVTWRRDEDRIWFRLQLSEPADPDRIGVNLALDLDEDQNNGNGWWAGNRAFRYDRLVTVWVIRRNGGYRGTSGVADAADVASGQYVTSAPGAVAFAVDGNAILVGVKGDVLPQLKRVRMVVTVGTNTDWGDTAPDQGFAGLE
jgi:hypothetical protein